MDRRRLDRHYDRDIARHIASPSGEKWLSFMESREEGEAKGDHML
jgi:hypothetical protein